MLNFSSWLAGAAGGLLLLAPLASALAQAPTIISLTPAANARAVPRNASVVATFSQPLAAGSAGALKVFSSQRGGLRGLATVAGSTITVAPAAYDFRPGETVQYTVTTAAVSSGGALAQARVGRFSTAVGGTGRGTFGGGAEVAVGNAPQAVTVADVDGDGDLDLLTASSVTDLVSVRFNNGQGMFGTGQDVSMGGIISCLAVADVDGDGDLDLLASDYNSCYGTSVGVRLNNGLGLFGLSQRVLVSPGPNALVLGDVDGDGDLDLLATSCSFGSSGTVSVRLNNGAGVFGGNQNVLVNGSATNVALGDVDNDGDLDLLAAITGISTVSVCLNDGTGTFGNFQDTYTNVAAMKLATGDLDGDGDLDLVVGSVMGSSISVRFNNGNGLFNSGQVLQVGSFPYAVTLGDVDADGDLDLLAANSNNGVASTVSVLLNNGSGAFSASQLVSTGANSIDLVLGDIDADGDLDLLTCNSVANSVSIRLNNGTGPLATAPSRARAALTAYPNPTTGRVALALPPAATRAELLDPLGRVVRVVPALAGTATLDVTGLAPGLYVVRAAGEAVRLVVE